MASTFDEVMATGIYKLSKPYKFGDEAPVKELKFPLADMTGNHARVAQRQYEMLEGHPLSEGGNLPEFDKTFQAYLAAAVMNVSPDFVFGLPVKDFTKITMMVQGFLLRSGSEGELETEAAPD